LQTEQSEKIDELAAALCNVQAQLRPAVKDSQNPHLKNKYADLNSVWDAIRPLCEVSGLAIIQSGEVLANGSQALATTIMHRSGQWLRGRFILKSLPQKGINENQAFGSSISYMRRYALASMLGVVQDDDDGATAAPPMSAEVRALTAAREGVANIIGQLSRRFPVETADYLNDVLADYADLSDLTLAETADAITITDRLRNFGNKMREEKKAEAEAVAQ
jgi:hypothetical protein